MGGKRGGATARRAPGLPPARARGLAPGLAAGLGARRPAAHEGRGRGLGPARGAWGRVDAVLGRKRPGEGGRGTRDRSVSGFLRMAGLTKRWAHDVVVGPVTLDISPGGNVAPPRPSGSGKKTPLRPLARS